MYIPKRFSLREFLRSEVAERAGWVDVPSFQVVYNLSELCRLVLDPIAIEYGEAVVVTSGWRSDRLNRAVGGVEISQHKVGLAADVRPLLIDEFKTFCNTILEMINQGKIVPDQVIIYRRRRFVHISWRNEPRKEIFYKE